MSDDMTPESIFKLWAFQDVFQEEALKMVEAGAQMGALALAKHIMLAQIGNGNRTLNKDEMMKLVHLSAKEVTINTTKMVNDLRNPNAETRD